MSSSTSFFSEPRFILKKVGDILRLLSDISALVLPIFIDVLEFFEGFDHVDIVTKVDHDVFWSLMKAIVQDR